MIEMQNNKEKILTRVFRVAISCSLILFSFLVFQIINGKYENHYTLVWSWFIITNLPLTIFLTYLYINNLHLLGSFTEKKLKALLYVVLGYFSLNLLIVFVIIPLGWLIAGIGYKQIFLSTILIYGFAQLFLILALRRTNINWSNIPIRTDNKKSKSYYSKEQLQPNEDFQKILSNSKILVGKGKSLEAIEAIEMYFNSRELENPNELILLKNNFIETRKELNLGLIEFKDAKLVFNRINNSLLNYISDFKN